jgi:hypothetical protein
MPQFSGNSTTPIADKDAAETFAESDVMLSHSNTEAASQSIRLRNDITGDTVSRSADDGSFGNTTVDAFDIVPTDYALSGFDGEIGSNTGTIIRVTVYRESDGATIGEWTGSQSSGTVTVPFDTYAVPGERYRVEIEQDGSGLGLLQNTSYPYTSTHVDIKDPGGGYFWVFNSVTPDYQAATGSVYVEWPNPDDVFRWDAATFTRTEDGGDVTVNIEENDGTGWTEITPNIARGDSIDAAPDSEVRFRVDMDRTETTNAPTLDSIYRRWVV